MAGVAFKLELHASLRAAGLIYVYGLITESGFV